MSAQVISEAQRERMVELWRRLGPGSLAPILGPDGALLAWGISKGMLTAHVRAATSSGDRAEAVARAHYGMGLAMLGPGAVAHARAVAGRLAELETAP
jgi:hypothetical protein